MANHEIYFGSSKTPTIVQSSLSRYRPDRKDVTWKIFDQDTGVLVDSHTPPKRERVKPCTPYEGSWAQTMEKSHA